jgi:hypothetical protein
MIAQRFRSVAWVAGVATAATLLYMISAQVAAERGRLEAVDQQIAETKGQLRQLQTEMGTRSSLRQLERWNGDVLTLSAPSARQYVDGEDGISSISSANLGREGVAPPPVMASVLAQPAKASETTDQPKILSEQDHIVQRAITARTPEVKVITTPVTKSRPAIAIKVATAAPVTAKERKLADIIKTVKTEIHHGGAAK